MSDRSMFDPSLPTYSSSAGLNKKGLRLDNGFPSVWMLHPDQIVSIETKVPAPYNTVSIRKQAGITFLVMVLHRCYK